MPRGLIRILLTILMYAGVAVFCFPWLLGQSDGLHAYQVAAVAVAVVCGLVRCYWSDEDCWWHVKP